ncbi:DNA replication initiation control protein YabA [Lacticaseibacillus pantheris]|jgi:regulator of replication initiation timing|uniref:Initiation-control protein YabA n=1 Tax=Lacticaseibacillus pantheris DSM 15945 = JCM 12539 = NBRC 106106 TaxID=1423783 RepID=A0A0R1U0S3_9LACO|nr:DNA replication initiation control protein YabA [Lacticaseibacillus pantheris]KRL86909.1 hypothetical protein FC50_GL000100 [Lacticaseibacillus pantheris DSM 15945 = JCM 12539 = NBRC 106106]WKF85683.1 DNA replication initiation control protein YabA [Lacticaseibacillus pantheris]
MADRDVFEEFQQAADTASALAQKLENLREDFTAVLEQNAELKIENEHLRDRLQELIEPDGTPKGKPSQGGLSKSKANLEKIYNEGYHVCSFQYGSRRVDGEPCAFCSAVIYADADGERSGN